ncbi:MAG: tetratricopeptide repeat protein [Pirellulales bacterium]|nr:tetratricopeptide repeat protein [Pirellulales bacterium]
MDASFQPPRSFHPFFALAIFAATALAVGCASPGGMADPFGLGQINNTPQPPEGYTYRSQGPSGFGQNGFGQGGTGAGGAGSAAAGGGLGSGQGGYTGRAGASGINRLRPRDTDDLAPSPVDAIWKRIKYTFTGGPNEETARQQYTEADALFRQKDYDGAADLYGKAAASFPDSLIEEDAWFMMAECYFFADRYPKAEDAYGELLKKYDNTRHLDTVTRRMFSIAQYWDRLQKEDERFALNPNILDKSRPVWDTGGRAIKTLENVWLADPTGPLADDAVMQLANLHFLKENWEDADLYYTQIRQDFPNSQYLVPAYMLGFRTKLERYDGAGYDRTPLDEAEILIETLLNQFSDQLGESSQLVKEARELVRSNKAEREWAMGEFYRRKGENAAAQMYYRNAVEDFPGTQYAALSQSRLADSSGMPATPPERFVWLTSLFPERGEQGPKPIEQPDAVLR